MAASTAPKLLHLWRRRHPVYECRMNGRGTGSSSFRNNLGDSGVWGGVKGGSLMQRVLIATLMALFFGLFSMPALQAAPANGWAVGSAVKAISPLETIYYRRRYRRRRYRRYRRYRW